MSINNIPFINEKHKDNFTILSTYWMRALTDVEYQSALYIMATPFIFDKVSKHLKEFESPCDWIWRWEWNYNIEHEEGEEVEKSNIPYDLTSSMVQLGKLALNLWNGYGGFNMLDCLNVLDKENEKVFYNAIKIRLGAFKNA